MKKIVLYALSALILISMCSCSADQLGLTTTSPTANTAAGSQTQPKETETDSEGNQIVPEQTVFDISSDAYYSMFAGDKILKIDVTMSSADLGSMRKYAADETYYSADVTVDGVVCENAAIRTRGNVTYVTNSQSNRYSYKINFGKNIKGGNVNGLDELCLNNMAYDPSFLREYLTYKAFAYIDAKAPLVSIAEVSLNGEQAGVYLAVESVDNSFLKRYFGSSDGNLYKAGRDSTLVNGSFGFELKSGDDTTLSKIVSLSDALKSKQNIDSILDVSSVLKYAAVNAVITNEDSYLGTKAQNYYLYESNGKISVLPWDYNLAFGTDTSARKDQYTVKTALASASVLEPYFDVAPSERPLVSVLLENEEYKNEYMSYVAKLTEYLDLVQKDMNLLKDTVKASVSADTTKFYTYELFEKEFTDSTEALFGFMKSRNESVKNQIK